MTTKADYNQCIKDVIYKYYKVDESSLSTLYNLAEIKHFKKNEIILPVGKIANDICILYKGVVIAYFLDENGNAYNKNIFLENNLVGSTVSYLTNSPSKFALEALEDSIIISFNYKKYRELIFNNDNFKNYYISYLEKQWIIEKEKREIDIVMKDASVRYEEFLEQYPNIDKKIPLNHIASHLGITPRQFSRIRKIIKN
ncbi:Crp/Fnr family transcriptional regulator [Maribacter sp. HTCC2170]|uniref:Crp/Fnr family transcriptional regulator n=1 Tax=Maribacter sp. (strain HTCC2170 / KCCM 42371) TaxID=313603 RepID=UPI00006B218E|nr:Crp/Fnr family transcriptional regulator [Maribacter sp. HTCC2170]EAR00050.1 Catabolite gene activator protein [Maribacter sp. HTCC2170]